jgi:hypothetical protein
MSEELEPVGNQEFILRRIHASYYRDGLPNPVQRAAFRPTKHDTTGLSVYRARFVQQIMDVLRLVAEEKRGQYHICRLAVRDLKKLGLTVVPDPAPEDIPGHCIIPELSWPKYQAEHDKLAEIQEKLAILAAQDIVHRPPA